MKNKITKLFTLLIMAAMSMGVWADNVSIPQDLGSYIVVGSSTGADGFASYITKNNCQVDSRKGDAGNSKYYTIGSTRADTKVDFHVTASAAGRYVFGFKSGASGCSSVITVKMTKEGSDTPMYTSGDVTISDDGNWDPNIAHNFFIEGVEAANYTLSFEVKEITSGSYAGNFGNFFFHTTDQLAWPTSSAYMELSDGTFKNARDNNDNVINYINRSGGYIDDLLIYNDEASCREFHFNIDAKKQDAKVTITVTDFATSVQEAQETIIITNNGDYAKNLSSLFSSGLKIVRFDFSDNDDVADNDYLFNFRQVYFKTISLLPMYGINYLDLSVGTFGRTASAKYDHNPQYESANQNIGFNGDGGYAEYYVGNTNPADYYELHLGTNRYQEDATFSITITDVATDSEEVNQDFAVPSGSSYADLTCVLYNKITPGLKKIRIETHSSSSSYAFNYNHVCFRSIPALPIESALDLEHGTYNNAKWNNDNVINYIKAAGASIDNLYVHNENEGFYKFCFNIAHLKQNSKVGITITDMATGNVEVDNQTLEITSTGDKEIRFTNALSVGLKKIRFDFTDADSEHTDEHLFNFQTVTLPAVTYDPLPQTTVATMDLNQAGVTFNNCSYEAGNSNIGFIKNGSYADNYYIYNTNPTAHYTLCAGIPWYKKGGKFKITVTDVATGNIEVDAQESPTITATGDVQFNLTNTITSGLKKIRFDFVNEGETDYLFNLNNVSFSASRYIREHPHMNLNTLCYPYQIDSYTGATFYNILSTTVEGGNLTELVLEEHVGALEAGVPYFYDPTPGEAELVCYYSGAEVSTPGTAAGGAFVGTYVDDAPVPSGSYVTVNNQLYKTGDGATMGEYRAYVRPQAYTRAALPGRKILRIGDKGTTTAVETLLPAASCSQKILRNGQVIIIRGDKKYNMLGQEL